MKKAIPERKHYLDNLKALALLLLVPWHLFVHAYRYYAFVFERMGAFLPAAIYNGLIEPWWREFMFVLAGIALCHSFARRDLKEILKERTQKLLVPLVFTLLIFLPAIPYLVSKSPQGYGVYSFEHLWFILFLYPMTLLFSPLAAHLKRRGKKRAEGKIPMKASFAGKIPWPLLYAFALIPLLAARAVPLPDDPSVAYNGLVKYTVYFLLGYFLLADEGVMGKLEKYRFAALGMFVAAMLLVYVGPVSRAAPHMSGWFASLAFLGLARRHWNSGGGKILRYLSKSSFAVYLFHNTYIAIFLFLFTKFIRSPYLLLSLALLCTFALTFLTYEILKRFRVTRFMFALKK